MTSFRSCTSSMLAAMCLVATAAAAQNSTAPSDDLARAPRISMSEFKAMLAHGDVLVLDVRDPEAYKNGHIPGARSLPLADIAARAAELRSERRPIVAYCAWPAEHTSARAVLELGKLGVVNVRALKGGINQWQSEGNPVVKGMGEK